MVTKDLENERGHASGMAVAPWSFFSTPPSDYVVEPLESNPDLRFPDSVAVYDTMSRTDPQVSANLRAMRQPILNAGWGLEGDDVRPEVMEHVRKNLGMPVEGEPRRRRRRQGVVLGEHLRDALSCLPHGFSVFEQVYVYDTNDGRLHLRKLAPRPQRTIRHIYVGRDGGLAGVEQEPAPTKSLTDRLKPVRIPVDRLVWYTLEKEGADWTGTSVLRSSYKPWLLKDRTERLAAQIIERNGMGVPVITHDGDKQEAERIASQFKAGAMAYAALPQTMKLELLGVSGSTVDPLPFIKRQDEAISKSMLAMFLDLGHDSGARSLGESFVDMFLTSCQAVADTLADTITEHVIRDLVEHNWGADEPYPVLTPGDLLAAKGLDVDGLKALADARLLTPDATLEGALRTKHGLPQHDPATATPAPETALSEPSHLPQLDQYLTRLENLRKDR